MARIGESKGLETLLSMPTTVIESREVGPWKESQMAWRAPVSIKNGMALPSTVRVTQGVASEVFHRASRAFGQP